MRRQPLAAGLARCNYERGAVRATVKDVARRAGVSPKTVSNVMNGVVPVSGATRPRWSRPSSNWTACPTFPPAAAQRQVGRYRPGAAGPGHSLPAMEIAHNVVEVAHEQGWIVQDRRNRVRSPARIRAHVPRPVKPH